jgi:hypothetical protein
MVSSTFDTISEKLSVTPKIPEKTSHIFRGIAMKRNILRFILALSLIILYSCISSRLTEDKSGVGQTSSGSDVQISAVQGNANLPGSKISEENHKLNYNKFEYATIR